MQINDQGKWIFVIDLDWIIKSVGRNLSCKYRRSLWFIKFNIAPMTIAYFIYNGLIIVMFVQYSDNSSAFSPKG